MRDTIYRDEAIKALDNAWINGTSLLDANEAVKQLKDLPSADRPQGHWEIYIVSPFDGEDCRCSECGAMGCVPYWDYCPYCGVRMGGADE